MEETRESLWQTNLPTHVRWVEQNFKQAVKNQLQNPRQEARRKKRPQFIKYTYPSVDLITLQIIHQTLFINIALNYLSPEKSLNYAPSLCNLSWQILSGNKALIFEKLGT